MMPAVLLAGFCTIMAALAACRLALAEDRTPVDIGTTLLVFAITSFVLIWASAQVGLPTVLLGVFVVAGLLGGYGGIVLLARGW